MPITASQVAQLRQRTGVSMLAVKNALEEAGGDDEKAIEILRKRGQAQAVKKSSREQAEGMIFLEKENGKAAIVQVSCETDFVARSDDFRTAGQSLAKIALKNGVEIARKEAADLMPTLVSKLGENISLAGIRVIEGSVLGSYVHTNCKIGVVIALEGGSEEVAKNTAMHAAAMAPDVIAPEEVRAELVEKEKEIWRAQLKNEKKPENIWDKIMMGKERKFREESALLKQAFAKDPSQTVEQYLKGAKVTAYIRMAV